MLDEDVARWASADAAAARLTAAAIVAGHRDPAWTAAQAQAADFLALVLYAIAVHGTLDPVSVPTRQVRDAVASAGLRQMLDVALAGTVREDWPAHLRRHDPTVTAGGAQQHAGHVTVAAMMADVYGLRLLDRVLAPLHGRDGLYPGRLVEVSTDRPQPGFDDIEFVVRVRMDHHRDDTLAVAHEVLLDIDPGDTEHGRGTHAHAVRCAVADLRRAADGLTRTDAEATFAVTELLQRIPLYVGYEDLHLQLTTVSATLLATVAPQQRRPLWRRPAPFKEQVLADVQRGLESLRRSPLTTAQREQQRTFLLNAARRLDTANL